MQESYLTGLNEAQKQAVLHTEGPLLIVAGAGAGKTKTLTTRIVRLLDKGVAGKNILALTFTNKAAKEMRERVSGMVSEKNLETFPFIGTFHSLGVRILKEYGDKTGRGKNFTILDEGDTLGIIKEIITELGFDPKQYEPKKFRALISKEKGLGNTQEFYETRIGSSFEEFVNQVWRKYEQKLQTQKGFDFDDLLLAPLKLLRTHREIKTAYQELFTYIHIDEYQDTNGVQYNLIQELIGENKNICVVGDTDQNIYSWRGANLKNMLNFEKDFPGAKILFLEENYRSTSIILDAANQIIQKNEVRVPKNLFTQNKGGELLTLLEGYDEKDEALYITDIVTELWDKGTPLSECAILYRANYQSRALEEAFLSRNIPYHVLGTRFYDRKEVKDVLSYIRASVNPDSHSDIKRIINTPVRGIGKVTLTKLLAGQKEDLPDKVRQKIEEFYKILNDIKKQIEKVAPSEVVKYVLIRSGLKNEFSKRTDEDVDRLENVEELVSLAKKFDTLAIGEGMEKMLEEMALLGDQDTLEEKKNGIRLMTIHASKGLEFKVVFITGLEHGIFPHARDEGKSKEDREEERRLFYVALTRAKERVFLSYATIRTIFGERRAQTPSEFIYDIPEYLLYRDDRQRGKTQKIIYIE